MMITHTRWAGHRRFRHSGVLSLPCCHNAVVTMCCHMRTRTVLQGIVVVFQKTMAFRVTAVMVRNKLLLEND
jgi:hypothetical protein